jgi:hypothetical protein
MPKIVKLGELLPADFVIELSEGERYTLPGDPPLELILTLASLFERTENMNGADENEVGLEVLREINAEMLTLLQMRQPELTSSPFGVIGVQHVVAQLLQAYNFGTASDEEDEDGEENPQPASRSKRSSGSPSSSKSSGSRRTTGAGSRGPSTKRGSA